MMNQEHIEMILAALEEYAFVREAHYDGLPAALADAQAARQVMAALRQPPAEAQPNVDGLLPCAFCGSEAQITEHKSASLRTVYMVSCVACEDECSKQSHEREQAIVAWNRRTPQPLLCERCNDYLEAPSYCEICYGTIESAWKEAEAKVAPQPPAPSVPTDAIRYCWRWAQLYAEKAEDEARYNFMCEQIDKVVQWVEPTPSALAAQPSAPA